MSKWEITLNLLNLSTVTVGVVLFDPNGRTETGRVYSDEHVAFVYDKYVEEPYLSQADCGIENVFIVCHSAGGMATTRILNERTKYLLPRVRGVAGTDTFFGRASSSNVQKVYRERIVNWVTSREPIGTILGDHTPKRVSAVCLQVHLSFDHWSIHFEAKHHVTTRYEGCYGVKGEVAL